MAERRQRITKRPEDRRQDLLDAAVRVMAEKGIAATTVADVTEAAGVAKGTFYLYFASKEQLLAALRERFVDESVAHALTLYERVGREDWWALADTAVESIVDFMVERRDALQIFTQQSLTPETRDTLAECERKLNQLMASAIQAGMDAGAFLVSDPLVTATLIHHALEGAVLEAVLFDQRVDRDRIVAAARELVHKVLAP